MKYEYLLLSPTRIFVEDSIIEEPDFWSQLQEVVMQKNPGLFRNKEDINPISLKEEGFVLKYLGPVE